MPHQFLPGLQRLQGFALARGPGTSAHGTKGHLQLWKVDVGVDPAIANQAWWLSREGALGEGVVLRREEQLGFREELSRETRPRLRNSKSLPGDGGLRPCANCRSLHASEEMTQPGERAPRGKEAGACTRWNIFCPWCPREEHIITHGVSGSTQKPTQNAYQH